MDFLSREQLTTEHLGRVGSRFDLVLRAIDLAKYWIYSGHEPIHTNNMAVEVYEAMTIDPMILDEAKKPLPERREEMTLNEEIVQTK